MKIYTIRRTDTDDAIRVKATSPVHAMHQMMDKRYQSWHGPVHIDGLYEIYSIDGLRLLFAVQEVR